MSKKHEEAENFSKNKIHVLTNKLQSLEKQVDKKNEAIQKLEFPEYKNEDLNDLIHSEEELDGTPMKDLDIQDNNFDFNELGEQYTSGSCKKCQTLKDQISKQYEMQKKIEDL